MLACAGAQAADQAAEYAVGADLSFLAQAERQGVVFKDHGQPREALGIFRDHGYNWVRLRLFHTPAELPNQLDYTIAAAQQAKRLGFHFLLDFHYSDTWADPGHQVTPGAWAHLSHAQLVKAVYAYSRDTIAALREAGAMPDMVQPGNEVTAGMMWPDGRLPDHWDRFLDLLRAAIDGIHAGSGTVTPPRILIHIDRGGDRGATGYFFDKLVAARIPFDVIGQSYYPWWHGGLDALRDNLSYMAGAYGKDIVVVETAYSWKFSEFKGKRPPWPESPEGQKAFLEAVNAAVRATPQHRGIGLFWWEPAVQGSLRSRGLFDDEGNALPALSVFDPPAPAAEPHPAQ
jgi:arabinogalactan endo-1,4-beta-galactosidase